MKETIKNWIKKIPIAFTKNQKYDLLTNRVIREVCALDSNCIDVGCHKGEVLKIILKAAPNGQHYCFEPIPELYTYLTENFPKNCHFHQLGLSNKAGTTSFNHVVSNPAYSGFEQREYANDHEEIVPITVKIERLDAIIPTDVHIDFIKVDVEGAELEVFQGAEATIRRCKPILVFEHGKGAADYYGTTPEEVFDFLTDCGLNIMRLETFFQNKKPFSKAQFIEQFERHLNYYFIACPL